MKKQYFLSVTTDLPSGDIIISYRLRYHSLSWIVNTSIELKNETSRPLSGFTYGTSFITWTWRIFLHQRPWKCELDDVVLLFLFETKETPLQGFCLTYLFTCSFLINAEFSALAGRIVDESRILTGCSDVQKCCSSGWKRVTLWEVVRAKEKQVFSYHLSNDYFSKTVATLFSLNKD